MLKSRKLRKRKVLRVIRAASFCFGRYGHLSLFTNELHSTKKKKRVLEIYGMQKIESKFLTARFYKMIFQNPWLAMKKAAENIWNMQIGIFRE